MHHRKSYRLKGYDYACSGLYYITICTKNRELFFGSVENHTMFANPVGKTAIQNWSDISTHFRNVILHEFGKPIGGSIPVIINQYKSAVKRWCNKNHHEDFQWQSRYYDHIIRSFDEYEHIADYIHDNPAKWKYDSFYHK